MPEECCSGQPYLVRELEYRGGKVRIALWYARNPGPEDTGFGMIRDVGLDPRVRGFPVLKAEVESTRSGYENLFGWIQVVAHLDADGSIEDWSPDSIPALRDRGVPFVFIGYEPTFFDAPFWPELPRLNWRADLFLCPLIVRRPSEEDIEPLVGFRWGFRVPSAGASPELLPLEEVGREAWAEALPRLRFHFPSWRFTDRRRGGGG